MCELYILEFKAICQFTEAFITRYFGGMFVCLFLHMKKKKNTANWVLFFYRFYSLRASVSTAV